LERKIADAWLVAHWSAVTVLVAVSGGPDSVALARALAALHRPLGGRLTVAHFNHGWRGAESDADERFVCNLATELGLACEVGRAGVGEPRTGSEAIARRERYRFLRQTAERLGARYVALGHTADDQIETILHRILRGTGITGLAGMPRARALGEATSIIRPLLDVRRAAILAYLAALGQDYRTDATNQSLKFTRNRLRHELLPHLARRYNPRVDEALLRLARQAEDLQPTIERLLEQATERCVTENSPGLVRVDAAALRRFPRFVVRELFVACWRSQHWPEGDMTAEHWDQLGRLALIDDGPLAGRNLTSESSTSDPRWRITLPGTIRATRRDDEIVLEKR
jgi:tRNA(Ile)-lysidine synthase